MLAITKMALSMSDVIPGTFYIYLLLESLS